MIDLKKIKKLALENGFKLKYQISGKFELDLNVYKFAEALLEDKQAEIDLLKDQLAKVESVEYVIVPKEPTLKMLKVADKHIMDCNATPESAYKAMIEAAQEQNND